MAPCQELADGGRKACPRLERRGHPKGASVERAGGRTKRRVRKRGPAPYRRCDGAPRGAHTFARRCDYDTMTRPSARHPLAFAGRRKREDGVPGAAKNAGDNVCADLILRSIAKRCVSKDGPHVSRRAAIAALLTMRRKDAGLRWTLLFGYIRALSGRGEAPFQRPSSTLLAPAGAFLLPAPFQSRLKPP
jgi:hypothetical protein